jgi:hypothetical protein
MNVTGDPVMGRERPPFFRNVVDDERLSQLAVAQIRVTSAEPKPLRGRGMRLVR